MMPAIAANPSTEPDTICACQQYTSAEAAAAFLKHPAYATYRDEVTPLLAGEPLVQVLDIRWSKDA